MTCPKHPKYGVLRRPRCQCNTCWDLYYISILYPSTIVTQLTEQEFADTQALLRKFFLASHARTN